MRLRTLLATAAATTTVAAAAVAVAPSSPAATPPAWMRAKAAALATFAPPPAAVVTLKPAARGPGYAAESVSATVHVGPGRATPCTIVGELLVPGGVDGHHPAPVVVTTNGFGGSWNDTTTLGAAQAAAAFGYVGLTYSGLGFGGSGCQIELDSPAWDGMAASELISWLGTLPFVTKDGPDDPRVGMIGGSYGGSVQFATASVDPRLDAIVPVITWNDLSYSLAPENAVGAPASESGVEKWEWASLFFADGLSSPAQNGQPVPSGPTCPGFDPWICQAYVTSAGLGYLDPATMAHLRADSMVSWWRRLHLPVLLMQGEQDSLFDIQEAVANYRELQADGDPVSLVIQSWGHSNSSPAPGEFSFSAPFNGYEDVLVRDFFARWLSGRAASTGAPVQYFRPWVSYDPHGSAAPAYGTASAWPAGGAAVWRLSADGRLVAGGRAGGGQGAAAGTVAFANVPGGMGTSYSETSGVQSGPPFSSVGPMDAPGSAATFESGPLGAPVDVVGVPTVTVDLSSALPAGVGPATDPVLFGKLYDIAPDGTPTLVDSLVTAARLPRTGPVTLQLPGIVHRYATGHRLELVLATQDDAYLGMRVPDAYTVTLGPGHPGVLRVPVVPAGAQRQGPLADGS